MPRYRLTLEYDGSRFQGWQRQANGPSVQAALETAVAAITGEAVTAVAAGRTDSGVHAMAQTVHLDLERPFLIERLMGGLNHHLARQGVAVLEAAEADPAFHARFSARRRHYLYRIQNRRAPPTLLAGRVLHVARRLDAERMHAAALGLVGRHDFTSYRSSDCQALSPVKTLDHLAVLRTGDLVEVSASAPSFLHHQVRNMVGTLVLIGLGRAPVGFAAEALAARDRAAAGPTAAAAGLYFVRADYPDER